MITIGKVHINKISLVAMLSYLAIKITALICSTIIAIKLYWWLGAILFLASCFLRFEFYYNPNFKDELEKGDEAK